MSMTSPMSNAVTSTSIGSAPESSCVLKKIGAILPPRVTPPKRLFGTKGRSSPVAQITPLVALLRLRHGGDACARATDRAVGGARAPGAGADDVADVGHQVALLLQVLDELDRAAL